MSIRVVVADDQDLVRAGLVLILGAYPDIEVVGEAADGIAALDLATRLRPDVLLADIRMPGLDGVEVTRRVAGPDVANPIAVVVITGRAGSCSRTPAPSCSSRPFARPRPGTPSSRRT